MEKVSTIGLDVAKHVFQVHGVDAEGAVVMRQKLRRDDVVAFFASLPACLIGIEACATSHHWARVLMGLGHKIRLMPASYVKPYVKRQKNDAMDAEAICEAVTRPSMRFVPVKSEEQQSVLMLHRVRELLVRQRTMLVNALRGHLAEFGIVTRQGIAGVGMLIGLAEDENSALIPPLARDALVPLVEQLRAAHEKVRELDHQIHAWHRSNELSRRLETIPGIGPITVSAIVATATDASPVQIRPATRGLAWPRAATELVLRKGSDRPDQQAGRSLYPSTACSWRACRPRCQSSADRKREFPRTFCH